jgi:hypothetical protein
MGAARVVVVTILANDQVASSSTGGGTAPQYEDIIEITIRLNLAYSIVGTPGSPTRSKWSSDLTNNLAKLLSVPASRFSLITAIPAGTV